MLHHRIVAEPSSGVKRSSPSATPCGGVWQPLGPPEALSSSDSGYGTQSVRTDDSRTLNRGLNLHKLTTRLRPTQVPRALRIDRQPSKEEQDRYCDLCQLLGPQLADVATKKSCGPYAAKLRFYGEDVASSRPYFVIQCGRSVAKKFDKVLNQRCNRDQINATNDHMLPSFQLLVEVNPPKQFNYGSCTSIKVSIDATSTHTTLCGARLMCRVGDESSFATLGGVVEVQKGGSRRIYGLTVAHIVTRYDALAARSDCEWESDSTPSSVPDSDSEEPWLSATEDSHTAGEERSHPSPAQSCVLVDLECSLTTSRSSRAALRHQCQEQTPNGEATCRTIGVSPLFGQETATSDKEERETSPPREAVSLNHDLLEREGQSPFSAISNHDDSIAIQPLPRKQLHDPHDTWLPFGDLLYPNDTTELGTFGPKTVPHNLDWVAIAIAEESMLAANLWYASDEDGAFTSLSTVMPLSTLDSTARSLEVSLMVGQRRVCCGLVSTVPTFLHLPPSKDFVKAYTMTVTTNSGSAGAYSPKVRLVSNERIDLERGDCGTWVVCTETLQVIGVVCAKDDDGEVYIIPLESILLQMKDVFEADAVLLPHSLPLTQHSDPISDASFKVPEPAPMPESHPHQALRYRANSPRPGSESTSSDGISSGTLSQCTTGSEFGPAEPLQTGSASISEKTPRKRSNDHLVPPVAGTRLDITGDESCSTHDSIIPPELATLSSEREQLGKSRMGQELALHNSKPQDDLLAQLISADPPLTASGARQDAILQRSEGGSFKTSMTEPNPASDALNALMGATSLLPDVHSPSSDKEYDCPCCISVFVDRVGLEAHLDHHFRKSLHTCPICPEPPFNGISHLITHTLLHKTRDMPHCGTCFRPFRSSGDVAVHEAAVHPNASTGQHNDTTLESANLAARIPQGKSRSHPWDNVAAWSAVNAQEKGTSADMTGLDTRTSIGKHKKAADLDKRTASGKHWPITTLPKSIELDEYTKSIRTYLATHGATRAKSPEFRWTDLPHDRSRANPDEKQSKSRKTPEDRHWQAAN